MRNHILYATLVASLLVAFTEGVAQELESPLRYNPIARQQHEAEMRFAPRAQRGGGSLPIPFFDDFSRYTLPTSNPNIPVEWQQWSDNAAFINSTFPLNPMTIGVATLDGLASDGTPYSDTLYFPTITEAFLDWGLADLLTSMPINLSGLTPDDSVHLVFHVQGGGLGNAPDADGILGAEGDSLILEFYSPLQEGQWSRVWAIQGGGDATLFDTVFVNVSDFIYLQDGFRFRFKNYCTLHGALDHWHIDYVLLNDDISPANFVYDEVAFQYPNNSLLNFGLTSMPWTHYQTNQGLYMRDEIVYSQRNLGITSNITSRCTIAYDGVTQFTSDPDANTQSNGYSAFQRTLSLNNYVYTAPADTDSASFVVTVAYNPTDIYPQNDTMRFEQKFTNYYAYDDGTAERAYGLQDAGGKVALRFNTPVDDTLLGAYIYFEPIQYLATDQSFILQAWDDVSGEPGSTLTSEFDNFNFSLPHYYESGPNLFVYYDFINPVFVPAGNFYIGTLQQSDVSLNFGLDKNTNANGTQLLYQLQGSNEWTPSNISGSVMIRPVFRSTLTDWVNVHEPSTPPMNGVYPNPVDDQLNIRIPDTFQTCRYQIVNLTGQCITSGVISNRAILNIDTSAFPSGVYIIEYSGLNNELRSARFVKR
ncbi:MAG: T9SS type A sorting domain-containing protein [Flavobacteriales bacterium]